MSHSRETQSKYYILQEKEERARKAYCILGMAREQQGISWAYQRFRMFILSQTLPVVMYIIIVNLDKVVSTKVH